MNAKLRPFILGMIALVGILVMATPMPAQTQPSPRPEQTQLFDDRAATSLLGQFTQGLENRNQKQVLAVFDFVHMQDGFRYQQELISFLSHVESIRLHVNLIRASGDDRKGDLEADLEMEIDPGNGVLPVRKQGRANFSARSSAEGWKFVEVKPRRFFSADPDE